MQINVEVDIEKELSRLATGLEEATPQDILKWAFQQYHPDISLACSFGGITSMALLDMAVKIEPDVNVFYLDTDFLFPETYALRDEVARRYNINPVAFKSRWTPEAQAKEFGEALWNRDPDLCCELRKVEPNWRALEGKKAWIAGLRRDQSVERAQTPAVQWDAQFGLVKVNPLVNWDEQRVWAFIARHDLPYNPLHDRGYPSIGCTNCTRAVQPGEDPRAGRWSGTDQTECGLHVP